MSGTLNGHPVILARLKYIEEMALRCSKGKWAVSADWYKVVPKHGTKINLDPLPWALKKAFSVVNPNSTLHALTWSSTQVYLAGGFWLQTGVQQCATLLHETRHALQYEQGRLTHFKYLTSSKVREECEQEGYEFGNEWLHIMGRL